MRFETNSGEAMSARAAWHEAFVSGIRAIDYEELANGAGVQFTAKGSDNCTMSHCDQGKIQQAVFKLKEKNKVAWAWGMFAFAPDGAENKNTLMNILIQHCFDSVKTADFNPYMIRNSGIIAMCAINDAVLEDRTGDRVTRKRADMAALLWGPKLMAVCNDGRPAHQKKCRLNCRTCRGEIADLAKQYKKTWVPVFVRMKEALKALSGIALPPIATVVHTLVDKGNGDAAAAEDLATMLRTPVTAA